MERVYPFETTAPEWAAWDAARLPAGRVVARRRHAIVGWAALSAVSSRAVYCGVAEVSIYVAAAARGQGIGRTLLTALIDRSETAGLWTLQAGIFPENEASVALQSLGYKPVEVSRLVKDASAPGDSAEDIIRKALKAALR